MGDPSISDVWIEDCSIAAIIIQLVAEDLGLGSCWIQIRNRKHNENISSEDFIKRLLDISKEKKIEAIISIGHPDENHPPYANEQLCWNKIYDNA